VIIFLEFLHVCLVHCWCIGHRRGNRLTDNFQLLIMFYAYCVTVYIRFVECVIHMILHLCFDCLQIASYSLFVALMAFFAQVSDPAVGGTYMTLLNTLTNLGGNWPVTLMLSVVDNFTWRECVNKNATSRFVFTLLLNSFVLF
jgi:hypothetical protein